jgi:hypothetical protein
MKNKNIQKSCNKSNIKEQLILLVLLICQNAIAIEFFTKDIGKEPPSSVGHTSFGDLNGDGYTDIFVSEFHYFICYTFQCISPHSVDSPAQLFINDKKGGFVEQHNVFELAGKAVNHGLWEEITSYRTTIADINNDGNNDIIASNGGIFLNNGDAQFAEAIFPAIGSSINSIYAIDFDNDGILEVFNAGQIRKRTNLSPLKYETNHDFSINEDLFVKFADFNDDSFVDIISFGDDSNITIYLNDNNGSFSINNKVVLDLIEGTALVVGDINGDEKIDIVLSGGRYLTNMGEMNFNKVDSAYSVNESLIDKDYYNKVMVSDLILYNNDEFPDLLVTPYSSNQSSLSPGYVILINDGNGNFKELDNLFLSLIPDVTKVFANDINNDGFDDLILSKSNGYNFQKPDEVNQKELDLNDPVLFMTMDARITNPATATTQLSEYLKIQQSQFLSFDLNNDGIDEYLTVYTDDPVYDGSNLGWFKSSIDYLSRTMDHSLKLNKFELFNDELRDYKSISKGDVNGDGLDDLLVSFVACEPVCDSANIRVFYNSETGISPQNKQDFAFDFIVFPKQVIDFNGDGRDNVLQFFTDTSSQETVLKLRVIELDINTNIPHISEFNLSNLGVHISFIRDLNNDGIADIVYLNAQSKLYAIFGNNDLSSLSSPVLLIDQPISSFKIIDFNKDGVNDILLKTSNNPNTDYLYSINSNGEFVQSDSFDFAVNISLYDSKYIDLNNDGVFEVINNEQGIRIFQLSSNNSYSLIYVENSDLAFYDLKVIEDIDGDGKVEILFQNHIIYTRKLKFLPGLNFDPNHNGHGFSIENVGENLFYTVFYTYSRDGYPEWYADLNLFDEPRLDYWTVGEEQIDTIKYTYDYTNRSITAVTQNTDLGYLAHDKCTDNYGDINLIFGLDKNQFGIANEKHEWCSQPIVDYYQRPHNNLSGLWWGGVTDTGWGVSVSLVERESTTDLVAVLYYYDAEGNPRWLIGLQSGFEIGNEITLEMNMIKGYARYDTPRDLESFGAGTMTLLLNNPTHNLNQAGFMSLDVSYPGNEGGHWVRSNIPIALLSNPR